MGHGVSTAKVKDEFNPLFCNKESLEGNRCMADDDFARSFVYFIKSGGWKDNFSTHFRAEEYVTVSFDQLARGKLGVLHNYLLSLSRVEEFLFAPLTPVSRNEKNAEQDVSSMRSVPTHFGGISAATDPIAGGRRVKCFSSGEYAAILFSALYTMFWNVTDCESVFDVRSVGCTTTMEENYGTLFDESKPIETTEKTQRSAELIHEIVCDFPEASLVYEVQTTNWATDSWRAFEDSKFCIAIVDTLAPKFPFVYANRSFLYETVYRPKDLLGAPVSVLFGIDTEPLLCDVLMEAISQSKSVRVGLTLYTKHRYEIVCLVSVKAAGRYSVINIVNTENLLRGKDLKVQINLFFITCTNGVTDFFFYKNIHNTTHIVDGGRRAVPADLCG